MSRRSTTTAAVAVLLLAASCSTQEAAAPAGAAPQVQPGATLLGSVGTADAPEVFEIALTSEDGKPVEVVAAGTYTLVVQDYAQIHNFHLTGDGVDAATEVSAMGEETFQVTFQPGEYQYVCDPHPSMTGSLEVV